MRPGDGPDEGRGEAAASMDSRGQAEIEGRAGTGVDGETGAEAGADAAVPPGSPPAGPHGAKGLTEPAATPGAGALPGTSPDGEADAATC